MNKQTAIKLFEEKKIRTSRNEAKFNRGTNCTLVEPVTICNRFKLPVQKRKKQEGIEGTTICSTLKLLAQEKSSQPLECRK
jgi:hypothetical protein